MRVTVRYFAQLKAAAGTSRRELELPDGTSVAEAVRRVADEASADLARMLIDKHGRIHNTILVFVGEDCVPHDEERALRDGDVVDLMSPISGG